MPPICIITGSNGLVGSESVRFFASKGYKVVGLDNDMRATFFGPEASTRGTRLSLITDVPTYVHRSIDIRHKRYVDELFDLFRDQIEVVIHTAAQPSHDWAARDPLTDFEVNAIGTLNMLEATRKHCPKAAFVFTSTNKVYGDMPNRVFCVERETRFELGGFFDYADDYANQGFDENLPIDQCTHSLFGCSKLAADLMVQEYGRYFGMNTVCFRGGCLTGPAHAGAKLHGFLSYLVKCAVEGIPYQIIGHGGKQVRDNIHAHDLVSAFWEYVQNPRPGEVYNIGGGRERSCSVLEAVSLVERLTGQPMQVERVDTPRIGDHKWWITDTRKFESHYPAWKQEYTLEQTVAEIIEAAAVPC